MPSHAPRRLCRESDLQSLARLLAPHAAASCLVVLQGDSSELLTAYADSLRAAGTSIGGISECHVTALGVRYTPPRASLRPPLLRLVDTLQPFIGLLSPRAGAVLQATRAQVPLSSPVTPEQQVLDVDSFVGSLREAASAERQELILVQTSGADERSLKLFIEALQIGILPLLTHVKCRLVLALESNDAVAAVQRGAAIVGLPCSGMDVSPPTAGDIASCYDCDEDVAATILALSHGTATSARDVYASLRAANLLSDLDYSWKTGRGKAIGGFAAATLIQRLTAANLADGANARDALRVLGIYAVQGRYSSSEVAAVVAEELYAMSPEVLKELTQLLSTNGPLLLKDTVPDREPLVEFISEPLRIAATMLMEDSRTTAVTAEAFADRFASEPGMLPHVADLFERAGEAERGWTYRLAARQLGPAQEESWINLLTLPDWTQTLRPAQFEWAATSLIRLFPIAGRLNLEAGNRVLESAFAFAARGNMHIQLWPRIQLEAAAHAAAFGRTDLALINAVTAFHASQAGRGAVLKEVYAALGRYLTVARMLEDARFFLALASAHYPDSALPARLHLDVGRLLQAEGKPEAAMRNFQRGAERLADGGASVACDVAVAEMQAATGHAEHAVLRARIARERAAATRSWLITQDANDVLEDLGLPVEPGSWADYSPIFTDLAVDDLTPYAAFTIKEGPGLPDPLLPPAGEEMTAPLLFERLRGIAIGSIGGVKEDLARPAP